MGGIKVSYLFIGIIILQRLAELFIAQRNERWLRAQGAYEVGTSHYPSMLALHSSFFIVLLLEITFKKASLSSFFPILLLLFLLVQAVRIWCIHSLGRFWNTKILILPNANVVRKGPYRFLRHPNYLVVSLELFLLPFMFQAYFTAFLFTILNIVMLFVRIPIEERALRQATNYNETFK
ncbi:isoprenylcysteine carboxylmethyltransferase family protein [Metasolibacillus sp.]|uniref:isoprenylcysteine carboxyl methyltransferase family protein n=1 Tax=Metasolibacillus sp. TaxID=2703680 RepID=UPI0025F92055|nr:isoprenylcysteine carboxylmethyltransferase family protein [Metasolibacillus sp.]MCT6924033.1 isoprenylcysteine carboxyl methyltransferase [Metasolibacillus sp.]MCT6940109.1 isoprenylcysteine carboxyl methyltransferase [Metasolibacillus sp.]